MKRLGMGLILMSAPAFADEAAFRTCAVAAEGPELGSQFQRCSANWAAPCGAERTALEAAQCILDVASALRALTVSELETLEGEVSEPELAAIREGVSNDWARGDAACGLMRQRDQDQNVASGQAAVNDAFCRVLAAGEAAGAAVVYRGKP